MKVTPFNLGVTIAMSTCQNFQLLVWGSIGACWLNNTLDELALQKRAAAPKTKKYPMVGPLKYAHEIG
jgi:hypothetical protein